MAFLITNYLTKIGELKKKIVIGQYFFSGSQEDKSHLYREQLRLIIKIHVCHIIFISVIVPLSAVVIGHL